MKLRWLWVVCAILATGIVLAACSDENGSKPQVTQILTMQPTLDLDQIPVLGDNPAPPVPLAATDPRFPIEPAAGSVLVTGKTLYERFCASCHGIDGEGEQPDPLAPGAAPPHDATGHTWHHADQQNFLTVWQGRSVAGEMPGYYARLTPDEMISILAYIKTWWQPDQLENQMELTRSVAE
jgi:mono/diheme cytochrome c family protein